MTEASPVTRERRHLLLRLGLLVALGLPVSVHAEEDSAGAPNDEAKSDTDDDDTLSKYRTPFPVLTERTIGTASQPVEFSWRRTKAQLGASGSHLFELNNFDSYRAGAIGRFPTNGSIFEIGLHYVWVWDTFSSEQLGFTPYRQPGRPWRIELDATVGIPVAEGVVTTTPRWFPAAQMVLMLYAGVRYSWYPGSTEGMKLGQRVAALVSPVVTPTELTKLDERRLTAMQIDPERWGPLVGIGNDIYFAQGLFVSPRLMVAVPLLAPVTGSDLRWWGDASVAVGVAF